MNNWLLDHIDSGQYKNVSSWCQTIGYTALNMKHIKDCLNNKLGAIYQHSCLIQNITPIVIQYLPEYLRPYTKVGGLYQGCLILTSSDATWASQLRFELPALRDQLRKETTLYGLKTIKIKILEPEVSLKIQKPTPPLSRVTCELISQLSDDCKFEPLKQALKNLVI